MNAVDIINLSADLRLAIEHLRAATDKVTMGDLHRSEHHVETAQSRIADVLIRIKHEKEAA